MCPAAAPARAVLILCLIVGSRQLSITEFEVPTVLESGENAELRCRCEHTGEPEDALIIKWWWTPVGDGGEKFQLYQRIASEKGAPIRHNVEIKDNDTIVLLRATPADSGLYECEVSLMSEKSEEVRKHQELIIFTSGSGPNLTVWEVADGPDDDEEEDVFIECKADDVAPMPDIGLSINGQNVNITEYVSGPDAEGLFDIVGNATLSRTDVEGMEVRCELLYVDQRVSHPLYEDVQLYNPSGAWNSTDAPEDATETDVTLSPDSLQNQSGDSVQCRVTWVLVFALGLLTQMPALL